MTATSSDSSAHKKLPEGVLCAMCGNDLSSLTCERCPECGEDLSEFYEDDPPIPWEQRQELGLLRSYFATMALIYKHPIRFRHRLTTPVCPHAAESFRRFTTFWVSAGLGIVLVLLLLIPTDMTDFEYSLSLWGAAIGWITATLSVYWLPGLHMHARYTPDKDPIQVDRAMTNSLYMSYAFLPLMGGLPACSIVQLWKHKVGGWILTGLLLAITVIAALLIYYYNRHKYHRKQSTQINAHQIRKGLKYGLFAGILFTCFFLIGHSLLWFAIIIDSLW